MENYHYIVTDEGTELDGRATIEAAEALAYQYKQEDKETTPDDIRHYTIIDTDTGEAIETI